MSPAQADVLLFVYGTLRLPQVQLAMFGRVIDGHDDVLLGYTIDYLEVTEPHVVELIGRSTQPVLSATGNRVDKAFGRVLTVTIDEVEGADEHAAISHRRVAVELASGREAWVYIGH